MRPAHGSSMPLFAILLKTNHFFRENPSPEPRLKCFVDFEKPRVSSCAAMQNLESAVAAPAEAPLARHRPGYSSSATNFFLAELFCLPLPGGSARVIDGTSGGLWISS